MNTRTPKPPPQRRFWLHALLGLAILASTGCTAMRAHQQGQALIGRGQVLEGLQKLQEASTLEPHNPQYRSAYAREKDQTINQLLAAANTHMQERQWPQAQARLDTALRIDPKHIQARSAQERLKHDQETDALAQAAQQHLGKQRFTEAQAALQEALQRKPQDPRLLQLKAQLQSAEKAHNQAQAQAPQSPLQQTISFAFRDAPLAMVLNAMAQATGLNFITDPSLRTDALTSMTLNQKPVHEVLKALGPAHRMAYQALDGNTVLLYPEGSPAPEAQQDYKIRNFYLSHSNATQVATLLRTMAQAKDLHVDERLNLVMMRGTPSQLALAEQIIASQDQAEPEVMLELEVLEVSSNTMRDLGLRWPDQISASITGQGGTRGEISYDELRNPSTGLLSFQVTNPLITATLRQLDGDAKLLANPKIRIRNRDKANILIGERVPVVTTTTTANVGTSESVNYLDVGLKLNLEPTISLDQLVAMRVSLEVSNIIDTITRASGLQVYRLGTRNASTSLRVKDGETQILAGLIQKDERNSGQRVPYLGEFPLLGRLFSSTSAGQSNTEIVLLITPRIIRNIALPISGPKDIATGLPIPPSTAGSGANTVNNPGINPIFNPVANTAPMFPPPATLSPP